MKPPLSAIGWHQCYRRGGSPRPALLQRILTDCGKVREDKSIGRDSDG
jgi:hypothetical protein